MKPNTIKVTEVRPNIFLVYFNNYYNMSMHFMRYQEFYESTSPQFRGKSFQIMEFMEWYSKKFGKGCFTYPMDWGGFNIPGNVIKDVWDLGILDKNVYDYKMKEIYDQCASKSDKFYIIGSSGGRESALKHEVAHGFFYTIPEYKKEMTKLVKGLPDDFRKSLNKSLGKMGYTSKVYIDEIQAYMSTGMIDLFEVQVDGKDKPFIKLYNKYYKIK